MDALLDAISTTIREVKAQLSKRLDALETRIDGLKALDGQDGEPGPPGPKGEKGDPGPPAVLPDLEPLLARAIETRTLDITSDFGQKLRAKALEHGWR